MSRSPFVPSPPTRLPLDKQPATMASDIYTKALKLFEENAQLTDTELKCLKSTHNLQDVLVMVRAVCESRERTQKNPITRFMTSSVDETFERLERLSDVIDSISGSCPNPSGLVWGGMKLFLLVAPFRKLANLSQVYKDITGTFKCLVELIRDLFDLTRASNIYERLEQEFPECFPESGEVLTRLYYSIIEFCVRAVALYKKSKFRV
jgi:hypothetical protein